LGSGCRGLCITVFLPAKQRNGIQNPALSSEISFYGGAVLHPCFLGGVAYKSQKNGKNI